MIAKKFILLILFIGIYYFSFSQNLSIKEQAIEELKK